MEQSSGEPKVIKLADLDKEAYRLEFLIDKTEEKLVNWKWNSCTIIWDVWRINKIDLTEVYFLYN